MGPALSCPLPPNTGSWIRQCKSYLNGRGMVGWSCKNSLHMCIFILGNYIAAQSQCFNFNQVGTPKSALRSTVRGAPRIFSRGKFFFHVQWTVGCEKSTLRKLFTMLQASSVLPHSKKSKNRLQRCKSLNLTE